MAPLISRSMCFRTLTVEDEGKTPRCVPCPHGMVKAAYGDELFLCTTPPLSTSKALVFGGVGFFAFLCAFFLIRMVRTGSVYEAAGFLSSPVPFAFATLLGECVDYVSDGLACRNVMTSDDPAVQAEQTYYLILMIVSTIPFLLGLGERLDNLRWQLTRHHRAEERSRSSRGSSAVAPADDDDDEPEPTLEEAQDALKEVMYDIRGTFFRFFIFLFEDLPMIVMNARMVVKYGLNDITMVLSLLASCVLAGAKLMSMKFLRNHQKEKARLEALVRKLSR